MSSRLADLAVIARTEYAREWVAMPRHECPPLRVAKHEDVTIAFRRGEWQLFSYIDDCRHDIAYCPYCGEKLGAA